MCHDHINDTSIVDVWLLFLFLFVVIGVVVLHEGWWE